MVHTCHGFQCHVASGDGPFVVLLEQDGADETDDGGLVGKDVDDIGTPLDLLVETLGWIGNRYEDVGADVRPRFSSLNLAYFSI